jgi:hypothetical protein
VTLIGEGSEASFAGLGIGGDGTFSFNDVPPGRYRLIAETRQLPRPEFATGSPAPRFRESYDPARRTGAHAEVVVESGATVTVPLVLEPGRTIRGVVVSDTAGVDPFAITIAIRTRVAGGNEIRTGVRPETGVLPDGSFSIGGVTAGLVSLGSDEIALRSAVFEGRDLLDFPLEFAGDRDISGVVVTVTRSRSRLSGTLVGTSGSGESGFTIVLAAADRQYWTPFSRRVLVSDTGPAGRLSFEGMPPGAYLLAAVSDIQSGQHYDPAFLAGIAGAAIPVSISDNGTHVQNLRLAR